MYIPIWEGILTITIFKVLIINDLTFGMPIVLRVLYLTI
jgi:hypothetical protein